MRLRMPGDFWRRLVLERLHRILALLIVVQLIQCFANYWWEETYSIVYGVLIVTAATEVLFTKRFWLRISVQIASSVLFIIWKMPYKWAGWPDNWRLWDDISEFIVFHTEQLHPFIELAVGAIVTVHLLAWLGSRRSGAITVVVLSILVMASVDSFFPLELWHNIAWIVTIGLAWLVILHLRQLQARHPDSWEALAERPLDIAFPAIVIITIVLLTGIFMPRAPVFLEDPYTIWTEAQGRQVPAFGGEGGIQKVGSSGSKGSSLSGYSRDDRTIGGGFEFDYSPVMTITTSQRSYWRGETKAVYTGKGWTDSKNPNLMPLNNEADLPVVPQKGKDVETVEVIQTVSVIRRDKIPVLFAAGPVASLGDLKSDNNAGLRWNPEEWELRWSKPARVQSYSVVSKVAVLDEEALRKAVPAAESSIDISAYLQLPDTLPERVHQLALEQTSGLTNDYDRAKMLEQYLKKSFPYTNTPDLTRQTKRTSSDFVDSFLFEIKEGYCDYFSTSFVVMARSIGLPARWVKGYSSGFDPVALERARFEGGGIPEAPDPTGAGTYTVRNADAHSWAEVYFEGYGWMPFEPTSGFTVPQPLPEGEVYVPDTDVAVEPKPETGGLSESNKDWLVPVGAVGVIAIILFLVFLAYRSKRLVKLWDHIRHRGHTPNQRVVREMEKLLTFLQRKGLRRETNETIRETFTRWSGKFTSLRGEFDGALTNFEQARYGQDGGNELVLNAFNEAAANIRKAL